MTGYKLFTTSICIVLFTIMSDALAEVNSVKFILSLGYTEGGDTFPAVDIPNAEPGNDSAQQKVTAGGNLHGLAGFTFPMGSYFETLLAFGLHFNAATGKNDTSYIFNRWTLDAIPFYRGTSWRFGAGPTYHIRPEYSVSGENFDTVSIQFDNAVGYVVDAGYDFSLHGRVDIRYVAINYEFSELTNTKPLDGNNVGLYLSAAF